MLFFLALNEYQGVLFLDAGEMPERSKGAVLKTAERKFRGFESLSLRWLCSRFARTGSYPRRGDRAAEGDRLLSDLAPKTCYEGSNPSLSVT